MRARRPRAHRLRLALLVAVIGVIGGAPPDRTRGAADLSLFLLLPRATIEHALGAPVQISDVWIGGAWHVGLAADAPSRIEFPALSVPHGARLLLDAVVPGAMPGGLRSREPVETVTFTVEVETVSGAREIWSRALAPDGSGWTSADLPLDAFGDRSIRIVLSTSVAGAHRTSAAWGRLRLELPSSIALPPRFEVERDLLIGAPAAARTMGGPACDNRSWRLQVPPGAKLEIEGSAVPYAGVRALSPPPTFRAWVDGELAFERALVGGSGGFRHEIPLLHLAHRDVEVCTQIEGGSARQSTWSRVRVLRAAPLSPRTASGSRVLVLLVDTLRADRMGAYGCPEPISPHLDRLSRRSRVATSAQAQAPWTVPSVSSLFTGEYPRRQAKMVGYHLLPEAVTIAERARHDGMETLAIVANPLLDERWGFGRGFDTFLFAPTCRASSVRALLEEWLDASPPPAWFAYLHFMEPHEPYTPPKEWARLVLPDGDPDRTLEVANQKGQISTAMLAIRRAAYDGEIAGWDEELGRLLAALRRRGADEGTTLAVVADHGEELLDHGRLGHGSQLFQEVLHVPVLIRDGGVPRLDPRPLELRTLLGAILVGESPSTAGWVASGSTVARGAEESGGFAISDGRWTCLVTAEGTRLYDLTDDPGERIDVAGSHPAEVRRLLALPGTSLADGTFFEMPDGDGDATTSADQLDRLRALGYVD